MNWIIVGIVALLAAVFGNASPLTDVRALTVLISGENMGEPNGRGTGLLIDETHVLTCAHLLANQRDEFFVYTYPLGRIIKARVEAVDQPDDLAFLVLEDSVTLAAPPVFQETVEEGDSVLVVGNGLGSMKWIVSKGIISEREKDYLLSDALVNPGNSGGPWINDRGEIVALTDWRIGPVDHVPGLVGGISAKTINRVMNAYARRNDMQILIQQMLGGK